MQKDTFFKMQLIVNQIMKKEEDIFDSVQIILDVC